MNKDAHTYEGLILTNHMDLRASISSPTNIKTVSKRSRGHSRFDSWVSGKGPDRKLDPMFAFKGLAKQPVTCHKALWWRGAALCLVLKLLANVQSTLKPLGATINSEMQSISGDETNEVRPHFLIAAEDGAQGPIFRLPPEILTEIFLNWKAHTPEKQGLRVLSLTWVCHHWRELALSLPLLWNRIDFKNGDWVQHALTHSQDVLLSIDADIPSNRDPLLSTILASLSRIQRLSLSFDSTPSPQLSTSDDPAPFLECLELKQFDIADKIFSGAVPSLREVKLSDCIFSWPYIPVSTNLTTLSVINADAGPTYALVSILRGTPNLETLLLDDVFGEEIIVECEDPVPLLRLQSLSVHREWYHTTTALLQQISIPPSTNVSLGCLQSSSDDNTPLPLALQKCRYHHNAPCVAKELGIMTNESSYTLEVVEFDDPNPGPTFSINFHTGTPDVPVMALPLRNISQIDITLLTALTLSGFGSDISPHIFGALPHLRTLTVKDAAAESFVQLLIDESKRLSEIAQPGSMLHLVTFPALEILNIKINWYSEKFSLGDFASALGVRTSRLDRGLRQLNLVLFDEEVEENEMLTDLFLLVAGSVTCSTEPAE
ncbi:hypothetical protein BDN72DRAFT_882378 [Pluteus cervinus]|uniref:Uncharacterized protein n=1 Tax=Pluteus cervinus TaxID=181527 RepID=A0ACD3ABY4_9AGAR|nr:hypothetical protein BDN72DRAFT_882378 [Pluteus cervinus]